MADIHTLGKILSKLEDLSTGQQKLVDANKELERKLEMLQLGSVPPSPIPGSYRASHSSGGVEALATARHLSFSQPTSPYHTPTSASIGHPHNLPPMPGATSPIPSLSEVSLLSQTRPSDRGVPEVPGFDGLHLAEHVEQLVDKNGRVDKTKVEVPELYSKRVVLTTYPTQPNIHPFPLHWGAGPNPRDRGPVICSRQPRSLAIRNAIGAFGGSYSTYRAISVALKLLPVDFRPDFTKTQPPFAIGPHKSWWEKDDKGFPRIVGLDPFGAMAQQVWEREHLDGIDIRPTISQTWSHLKIEEIDKLYREGHLKVDGRVLMKSPDLPAFPGVDQGVEISVGKASIDPVWYLPGVAHRLGVEETLLRRALFEETGGMYSELLTRPDLKTFCPPIGGMTAYIIGNPAYLSDPTKELTFRPHDECNSSDVLGSSICTCRPYLIHGISESVKTAQRGGVGVVVYIRKEGRGFGEVLKYLVYNRRKRTEDSAAQYFKATEMIAGIEDQRYQDLHLPDILAWLGITKIDNLVSMSHLKYNSIVNSGVKVINRYEIPAELLPPDASVEISAKIAKGYHSDKAITDKDLEAIHGQAWDEAWDESLVHGSQLQ